MGSKIKKLLSLLMVVCMVASMLPTTVFATTGERTLTPEQKAYYDNIWENKYKTEGYTRKTVSDATEWSKLRGVTDKTSSGKIYIDVLDSFDVGTASQFQAGASSSSTAATGNKNVYIVINLNGNTITKQDASRFLAAYKGAHLTVLNGFIEYDAVYGSGAVFFMSGKTYLTLEDVDVNMTTGKAGGSGGIIGATTSGTEVVLKNCTLTTDIKDYKQGAAINAYNLTLENTTVNGTGATVTTNGGVVYVSNKLTMNGNSVIQGGSATDNGGTVYCKTLEMNDTAQITGGTAVNGGAVYCTDSLTMNGSSSIQNGTATSATENVYGGTVYAAGNATLNDNASISGGSAAFTGEGKKYAYGGAVYCAGTLQMNNNAQISGGSASSTGTIVDGKEIDYMYGMGGAVYHTGTLEMYNDAQISGGEAARGAALYSAGNATMNGNSSIVGGVANTTSTDYGGAVFAAVELTLNNYATIKGGYATDYGGCVYVTGKVTMNDNCVINAGDKEKPGVACNGDAVSLYGGELIINNGSIIGGPGEINGADVHGLALHFRNGSKVVMNGGSITNTAGSHLSGSVLYFHNSGYADCSFKMYGGTITDEYYKHLFNFRRKDGADLMTKDQVQIYNGTLVSRGNLEDTFYYYSPVAPCACAEETVEINESGVKIYTYNIWHYKPVDGTCPDCEHTYTNANTGTHTWGNWEKVNENEHKHICSVCGQPETAAHDYKSEVTAPTCTEKGYTTYTCSACGDSYKTDEVDPIAHSYDQQVVTDAYKDKDATCTAAATYFYSCSCGAKGTTTFSSGEAAGHDYKSAVTAPTCTEKGYTTYTCSVCDDSYISDYVDATGHDYDSVVTAPTCTEKGYTTYTCSACGDSYISDYVDATGHNADKGNGGGTPASCHTSGLKAYNHCSCGVFWYEVDGQQIVIKDIEAWADGEGKIPQLEHKVGECACKYKAVVTDPTCTEDGYTTYTCTVSNCEHSYKVESEGKLGHSYTYAQKDETYHTVGCSACTYTAEEKHTIENGACSVCNYVAAIYVAQIGEQKFTSLQAAFEEAQDGDTITLLDDITITAATAGYTDGNYTDGVRYTGDKSFTVDFGGHTVTDDGCVNDYLIYINNKGAKANEITFTNGSIVSKNGCWATVCVNGGAATQASILNLNGMKVTNSNDAAYNGNVAVRARNMATINASDGTIITSDGASYGIAANTSDSVINVNNGATVIQKNSGTTGGNSVFAAVGGKGVMNINAGAIIESDKYGVHTMTTGTPVVNVNGGTITAPIALKASTNGGVGELATINVTGGTINGALENYTNNGIIVVSGGTFSEAVAEKYCAEGYEPAYDEETGKYGVQEVKNYVAQVGNQKFTSLQAAFEEAQDGDTITLLADVALETSASNGAFEIAGGRELTLDLNGFDITAGAREGYTNRTQYAFDNYADLTITGKGTITSRGVQNYGTLTIDSADVTIIACDTNGGACVWAYAGSETNISAGTYKTNGGEAAVITSYGTLNITGGTYTQAAGNSATYAIIASDGTATISGATVTGIHGAVAAGATANVTIESGNYTVIGVAGQSDHCVYAAAGGVLTIKGGNFVGEATPDAGGQVVYGAGATIYGGTFSANETDNCAEGNHTVLVNGVYVYGAHSYTTEVIDPNFDEKGYDLHTCACGHTYKDNFTDKLIAVAKIGDTRYLTLADAIAAAQDGDTITLLTDIELTEGIVIAADDEITLDLNGHTVSMTDASGASCAMIKNNGTLTITDSGEGGKLSFATTVPGGQSYASNTVSNYGTLTINGGIIENTSESGVACYALDCYAGSTTTIAGGELTARSTTVRVFNWSDNDAVLNVTGGTIVSQVGYAINLNMGNTADVELNISGGEITTNDTNYNLAVYAYTNTGSDAYSAQDLVINVTGGTFNGALALNGRTSTTMGEENVSVSGGSIDEIICYGEPAYGFVSGGVFSEAVDSAYCAEGYAPSSYEVDGVTVYGVVEQEVNITVSDDVITSETFNEVYQQIVNVLVSAPESLTVVTGLSEQSNGKSVSLEKELTKIEEVNGVAILTYDVQPYVDNVAVDEFENEITFRLYVDARSKAARAEVIHDGVSMGKDFVVYTDAEGNKYVEVTSKTFSPYTVATVEPVAYNTTTGKGYETVAEAVAEAVDGDTIRLDSAETAISMNAVVDGNRTITFTGEALVDWTKGNLWIGREGNGNGKVIFDGATITSSEKKTTASYGIHVSGAKAGSAKTCNGILEIKNSTFELDYLINRNEVIISNNSNVTIYGGTYVHGRNASESASGTDEIATLIVKDSKLTIVNINGCGFGDESYGELILENADVDCKNALIVRNNGALKMDLNSTVKTTTLASVDGKVVIDASAFSGTPVTPIIADASAFDGTVDVINNDAVIYEASANGIAIKMAPKAHFESGAYVSTAPSKPREHLSIKLYDVYAENSLVVKVYSNGTHIATSTYRDYDLDDLNTYRYPLSAPKGVSVNLVISGKEAGSWDNVWHVAPSVAYIPDTYEVWVDGELKDTWTGGFSSDAEIAEFKAMEGVYKVASVTNGEAVDYYATLAEAIAAAQAGDVITMKQDVVVEDTIVISADKTIVLDLAGCTISQVKNQTAAYEMILNNGNLTVKDSIGGGLISYTDSGNGGEYVSNTITNRGTITLESGTIENGSAAIVGINGYPYVIDNDASGAATEAVVNIEGGVLNSVGYSAIRLRANSATKNSQVNISGGEIFGTIEVQKWGAGKNLGELNITGGKISNSATANVLFVFGSNGDGSALDINISGGELNGNLTIKDSVGSGFNKAIIPGDSAATFNTDVTALCEAGYEAVYNDQTGRYGIDLMDGIVARNEQTGEVYSTVASAVMMAAEGEVITMLTDATEVMVYVLPGVTLDLNGKTLTATYFAAGFDGAHVIDSSDDVTGLLVCSNTAFNISNKQIPVYTENGYRFMDAAFIYKVTYNATTGKYIFRTGFDFSGITDIELAKILADGSSDARLEVRIHLEWTTSDGNATDLNFRFLETLLTSYGTACDKAGTFKAESLLMYISSASALDGLTFTPQLVALNANGEVITVINGTTLDSNGNPVNE